MKPTFKQKLLAEAFDLYKIDSMLDNDDEFLDDVMMDEPTEDDPFDMETATGWGSDDDMFDDEELPDEGMDLDDPDMRVGSFGDFGVDSEGEPGEEELGEEEPGDGKSSRGNDGLIRTVRGAYMVFKRATESNNFEELWIFNMKDVKTQTKVRNSILAGTDIDPVTLISPEGDQSADVYSKGNIQFLHIDGLPN